MCGHFRDDLGRKEAVTAISALPPSAPLHFVQQKSRSFLLSTADPTSFASFRGIDTALRRPTARARPLRRIMIRFYAAAAATLMKVRGNGGFCTPGYFMKFLGEIIRC